MVCGSLLSSVNERKYDRQEFSRLLDRGSMAAFRDNGEPGARNSLSVRMAQRQGDDLITASPHYQRRNRNLRQAAAHHFLRRLGIPKQRALGKTIVGLELHRPGL